MVKKVKTKQKKESEVLKVLTSDLLDLMMIKSVAEVSEDKENATFTVNIKGEEESGLLIGSRGKTLQSLQTILSLMFRQKLGEWKRVLVNVSDWREKEEERLKDLAVQTAERVASSGEIQYLYNLTPAQRRIVHMALSEDERVETESQGEGNDRYLIVSPKK